MKQIKDRCVVDGFKGIITNIIENDRMYYSVGVDSLLYEVKFDDGKIRDQWYTVSYFKTIKELRLLKLERILENDKIN